MACFPSSSNSCTRLHNTLVSLTHNIYLSFSAFTTKFCDAALVLPFLCASLSPPLLLPSCKNHEVSFADPDFVETPVGKARFSEKSETYSGLSAAPYYTLLRLTTTRATEFFFFLGTHFPLFGALSLSHALTLSLSSLLSNVLSRMDHF